MKEKKGEDSEAVVSQLNVQGGIYVGEGRQSTVLGCNNLV